MLNNKPNHIVGCGYIGQLLARQLLDKNIPVSAIVSSESSLAACTSHNIPCEIKNLDEAMDAIDLTNQRVIYLTPPPRDGKTDSRISRFLQAIESHPPEKIVLISTTGVYGNCDGAWIDETAAINPAADRAFRRVDAERQVHQFCMCHDIPLVILRVAGIYGPGKIPLARIKSGEPIVNQQDSPYTNRVHAFDLVNICEQALLSQTITGIYNVTDGHPGTMYEYFMAIASAMHLPPPPAISLQQARHQLSAGMLSYMAESRRIDNKKLLNNFKIELLYPTLKDGLRRIMNNE